MTILADILPPGYETRFPGLRPVYAYSPYRTEQTLHRYVALGVNEFGDPETRRVWAPNRHAAKLVAMQHLSKVTVSENAERTVEPPGLD